MNSYMNTYFISTSSDPLRKHFYSSQNDGFFYSKFNDREITSNMRTDGQKSCKGVSGWGPKGHQTPLHYNPQHSRHGEYERKGMLDGVNIWRGRWWRKINRKGEMVVSHGGGGVRGEVTR